VERMGFEPTTPWLQKRSQALSNEKRLRIKHFSHLSAAPPRTPRKSVLFMIVSGVI